MLQLGFVGGDLVCERSDVRGKSAGWRSVAFHSGGLSVCVFFSLFFNSLLMSASAAICLTCDATNPSSRWQSKKI